MDSFSRVPSNNPQFYTELNQLNDLRRKASTDEQAALREAALQFEQIFMNMMLKSMRDANEVFAQDNPFNSNHTRFFQDMYDQQLTLDMSQRSTLGLADVLVRQLNQNNMGALDLRPGSNDEEKNGRVVSESERLLNRAFDSTASLAASAVLGQAHTLDKNKPAKAMDDDEPDWVEPVQTRARDDKSRAALAENLPPRFDTPQQFVESLLPLAEEMAAELGVDPKVLLAQAALETGWGRHIIAGSNNLFNIKAHNSWSGERVSVSTLEYRNGQPQTEVAAFRAYPSYADSFRDYVDFLRNNPRYSQALENTANPSAYLRELQAAGYATDPNYAQKIERIFNGNVLAQVARTTQEG